MRIYVLKIKIVVNENVVFPLIRYFLNPSHTKSLTNLLVFSSPSCQALKISKEWMSGVEAK